MTEQADERRASFRIGSGDRTDAMVVYDRENYLGWMQAGNPVDVRR